MARRSIAQQCARFYSSSSFSSSSISSSPQQTTTTAQSTEISWPQLKRKSSRRTLEESKNPAVTASLSHISPTAIGEDLEAAAAPPPPRATPKFSQVPSGTFIGSNATTGHFRPRVIALGAFGALDRKPTLVDRTTLDEQPPSEEKPSAQDESPSEHESPSQQHQPPSQQESPSNHKWSSKKQEWWYKHKYGSKHKSRLKRKDEPKIDEELIELESRGRLELGWDALMRLDPSEQISLVQTTSNAASLEPLRKNQDIITQEADNTTTTTASPPTAKLHSKRNMIIIKGLSTNLAPSDFYRLVPNDTLSSWSSTIRKVQQQRDPRTFEPLGIYQISFSISAAATAYYDSLCRIHALAQHKLHSQTGLWKSTLPPNLRSLSSSANNTRPDPDSFTIAPPSYPSLPISRTRTQLKHNWHQSLTHKLSSSSSNTDGWGPHTPVVLLQCSPTGLTAQDVQLCLDQDALLERGDVRWQISGVVPLEKDHEKAYMDMANRRLMKLEEKLKSRFLVPCLTDWEARRLHRAWNGKTLTREMEDGRVTRHCIQASVIVW